METDRYKKCFDKCKNENRIAFIPFVVIGDPDLEDSITIIKQLIDSGADALELGIPFSDPVADGPIIQAATIRALQSGFKMSQLEKVFIAIREYSAEIPIGLLVYANLVMHSGIESFIKKCADWEVDSILIPDVPVEESDLTKPLLDKHAVHSVFIAPPNASDETLLQVAHKSSGYTYLLGRKGITGTHVAAQVPLTDLVAQLKQQGAPPLVQGFGISTPEHIQQAVRTGLDGAICGSAIVNLLAESHARGENLSQTLEKLNSFLNSLKQATYKT